MATPNGVSPGDSSIDWVSGMYARRANECWANRIRASEEGKAATKALEDALAEQGAAAEPRRNSRMGELLKADDFDENKGNIQPTTNLRAPDIDPSLAYTASDKVYSCRKQRALDFGHSLEGQYEFNATEELDALGEIIVEESAPVTPVTPAAARRKKAKVLKRLRNAREFDRLMTLPQEKGEDAWSGLDHKKERKTGAELRKASKRSFSFNLGPAGLSLSALPPRRPVHGPRSLSPSPERLAVETQGNSDSVGD